MDTSAQRLVEDNVDYVRKLARQIVRGAVGAEEFEDLVSAGNLGLSKAAHDFDPRRGVAFTTFAYHHIRGSIFDYLRSISVEKSWMSRSVRRRVNRLAAENDVGADMVMPEGAADDPEFLAKQFRTAVGRLAGIFLLSGSGSDEEMELGGVDERDPASEAERVEITQKLARAIEQLPPEQAELLQALYFDDRTMTDVAASRGMNKSSISRHHTQALDALRQMLSG